MIVRTLDDVKGTSFDVGSTEWSSLRFLTRHDNVGFTLTDTRIKAGYEVTLQYKHHIEANYCIEGHGTVEDLSSGAVYEISPGTMYVVTSKDRHRLRAKTPLRLICVFNPPLAGPEKHGPDGSYAVT